MIINSANLRALFNGFSTAYQGGFDGVPPSYGDVAMVVPSSTKQQEYGWLGQMPRVREWIGDRTIQNLNLYNYTIRNRPFELTIGVDRDDLEDDNLGIYAPMFAEMGRAAASFPDELVWPLLNAGFVTPCYDKQPFFDTDHPVLDAAGRTVSVSNKSPGAGVPWFLVDDTRMVKPIVWQNRKPFNFVRMDQDNDEVVFARKEYRYGVDSRCNAGYGFWQLAYGSQLPLTTDNYAAARDAMIAMKGDHGRPLGLRPTKLFVPPALEPQARQVLLAEYNTDRSSNIWRNTAVPMVQPWLA